MACSKAVGIGTRPPARGQLAIRAPRPRCRGVLSRPAAPTLSKRARSSLPAAGLGADVDDLSLPTGKRRCMGAAGSAGNCRQRRGRLKRRELQAT
eukprot:8539687-Alexandrium_andersonii.AAC.1